MSDTPVFNSPGLRKAYDDCKADIESLRTNLDLISRDIKELEETLERNGVRIPVRGRLDKFPMEYSNTSGLLAWEECPVSKKWRLQFVTRTYDHESGHQDGEEAKPLIEAKAAVRIAAYQYLGNFLRVIAAAVKVEPLRHRRTEEDITFEGDKPESYEVDDSEPQVDEEK